MEKLDTAPITCRAPDGSPVATILITVDTDYSGPPKGAPLIRITPETAAENGETDIQLRENSRYYYDLDRGSDHRDLRLRSSLSRRRRNLKAHQVDAGRIETASFCGTLLLEIVEGDAADKAKPALATALVDVRSVKLHYRSEYRGMLRSLSTRMADLVADARSSAKMPFRSNFEGRKDKGWFQLQLELLHEVLESAEFASAIQRILTYPHERLQEESELVPVERPFRWTPTAVRSLINSPVRSALPASHPLRARTGLRSIASRVPVIHKTPTVDTAENRFVKYALRDFQGFLSRAQKIFEDASGDWSAPAGLSLRLALLVEQWLSRPFFKAVADTPAVPLGSPVLQRKAGYREVLRWWLRFHTAADLSWKGGEDLFRAGQRSVAELYEYWLFFALLDWFGERFNRAGEPPLVEQLVEGLDTESPTLRLKKQVPLGPFSGLFADPRRRLHAAFAYSREFRVTGQRRQGGTWTRKMHPDYTLTFWPAIDAMSPEASEQLAEEQELLVHIHLDAKYRVENLNALFGQAATDDADEEDAKSPGNYKRQDLLKMHAYRDAIKRSEGAYVLYPGDEECRLAQYKALQDGPDRWPHTMWGFHELLPGLGAFAIAPDEHGGAQGLDHLAKFLDEVLMNLCNRASLREQRASSLYEALRERRALYSAGQPADSGNLMLQDAPELDADRLRLPPAPDITVLAGWFDSPAAKRWMLDHRKVVLRLGNRRGTLPLIKSLATASHILLHGRAYDAVPGLFRISQSAGEVWTRAEVESAGFPPDATKPQDDIFAVFGVQPDPAFASLAWDARRLEAALFSYASRQRPAYRNQLNEFHRDRAKPQLVSLADLQTALAIPP